MHPTNIYIPEDLWQEFEAQAEGTSGPLPYLKLVVQDHIRYTNRIVTAAQVALRRPAPRSEVTIRKGVRWPTEFWDKIRDISYKLHTSKEGVIRLIIEGAVSEH